MFVHIITTSISSSKYSAQALQKKVPFLKHEVCITLNVLSYYHYFWESWSVKNLSKWQIWTAEELVYRNTVEERVTWLWRIFRWNLNILLLCNLLNIHETHCLVICFASIQILHFKLCIVYSLCSHIFTFVFPSFLKKILPLSCKICTNCVPINERHSLLIWSKKRSKTFLIVPYEINADIHLNLMFLLPIKEAITQADAYVDTKAVAL